MAIAQNFFNDALDPASGYIPPAIPQSMAKCQKVNPKTQGICGKPTSETEIMMMINNEIRTFVNSDMGIDSMLAPPSLKIGSNISEEMCMCTICLECVSLWHEEQIKEAETHGILPTNKEVTCPGCGKTAGKLPQLEGIMAENGIDFKVEKACVRTPAFYRQASRGGGANLMISPNKPITEQKIVLQFPHDMRADLILEWLNDIDLSDQYDFQDLARIEVFPDALKREKFEDDVKITWEPDPADRELDIKINLTFFKADMATKFLAFTAELENWQGESGVLAFLEHNNIKYRAVTDDWKPVISIVNKTKRNIEFNVQQTDSGGSYRAKSPKTGVGINTFQTFAPQRVLSKFRDFMHNAGLPDLARENAEYIITNCKGVFPFELATGQDQHVPVKKEHDGNQQDQHQKRGAWEEGDAKMEDQGGQEELSDDVKRALQELKSLQAQSIVKPSEAKAKERPPTITGKLIEAQPELKPLTERWIDKETFMEKYKTHICVVVNRDKETRGSMFNPYAGLQIKYRLLLQGEKKWGKWTCEPVDPNREPPGGPPALPFATFKAYFAPKEDIPFEEAKEELTKLVWAIQNEENDYRTRQPALEQNITVIDNN